jgi:hypothetical protein
LDGLLQSEMQAVKAPRAVTVFGGA